MAPYVKNVALIWHWGVSGRFRQKYPCHLLPLGLLDLAGAEKRPSLSIKKGCGAA